MKEITFKILILLIKYARRLFPNSGKVAVIAPASKGSLGDQALVQGLHEGLTSKGYELVEVLVGRGQEPQSLNGYTQTVLGPFFPYRTSILNLLIKTLGYRAIIIVGADTLDGTYNLDKDIFWLDICDACVGSGLKASIVSFSFSENPKQELVERVRQANDGVLFCSRDENSKRRFESATGKNCQLTADLAFLMVPASDRSNIASINAWALARKSAGSTVIAINANYLNRDEERGSIEDSYVEAIKSVSEKYVNVSFALVPHDFRPNQSDEIILSNIFMKAEERYPEIELRVLSGPLDCWDVKAVLKHVDLVLSGRMHLAIAGLSLGKPVYCISYKGKFEGLMSHIGIENNLIGLEESRSTDALSEFFLGAIASYTEDAAIVARSIERVRTLAKANLAALD